jgi:hypothetical protein
MSTVCIAPKAEDRLQVVPADIIEVSILVIPVVAGLHGYGTKLFGFRKADWWSFTKTHAAKRDSLILIIIHHWLI